MSEEKLRIDKYLWAIRIFKTRSQAGRACGEGKVRLNGQPVRASHVVVRGARYEIRTAARKWVIEAKDLLSRRGSYEQALQYYTDHTPEEDRQPSGNSQETAFFTGKRLSKTGRPTKKQRRNMQDYMEDSGPESDQ